MPIPVIVLSGGVVRACLIIIIVCLFGRVSVAEDNDAVGGGSADRVRVAHLMRQGRSAEDTGRLRSALDLYQTALMAAPHDEDVRRSVDRVRAMLGRRPVDDVEDVTREHVFHQLAEIEIVVLLRQAEREAAVNRFEDARARCKQAAELLRRFPHDISSARLKAVLERIDHIESDVSEFRRQGDRERRQAVQEERIAAMHAEETRAMNVLLARLMRIMELERRDHLELALAQSRRLLSEFPDDERAEALFYRILERVHIQRRLSTEERMAEMREELSHRINQALIPNAISGDPVFPDDWVTKRQYRQVLREDEKVVELWREQILNNLMSRLTVNFDGIDFIEAAEHIANQSGINMVIGTDVRSAPLIEVALSARGMRIDHILNWLCRQAGVTWSLRNEAVYIGETGDEGPMLRVYDVAGLLHRPPDMPGFDLNEALGSGADAGPGIGAAFFGGGQMGLDDGAMAIEDLIDMIQEAVAPDMWSNPLYGIAIRNNFLVVNAPAYVHTLLDEFLESMRRAHNQLVSIEVTWLEIRDDFVEEIGWNWINRDGVLSNAPVTQGYSNNYSSLSTAARTDHQLPGSAVSAGSNLLNQGLGMQFVRLGPPDISAVFTAVLNKRQARTVNGVNLTTINGVRANAFFARQIAYLASYSVVGGLLDPEIETLTIGQSLDIKPYISADRKYITLNIQPFLTDVDFFVEYILSPAFIGDDPAIVDVVTYPIELPNVRIFEAGTSVIVPDGGSLLVGGFGAFTDQHTSSKVPFLGHLPFLGRLFGRRGRYQERWRLYLKLAAKLILYDEVETMQ